MLLVKRISVLCALIIMLALNTMAVLLPLNGVTTKELSDNIPTYFVPAGYVFSIWSLIYLALIGYAVYQALPQAKQNSRLHSIAWWFVVNALANASWIVLWHYRFEEWSVLVMLVILATLIAIYQKLQIGRARVMTAEWWCTQAPFSLYLGWISVATIANIAAALYVQQWDGFGLDPQLWSVIMLCVATLLAGTMLWQRRDYIYAAVIVWAVIGIAVHYSNITLINRTAWGAAIVIVLLALIVRLTHKKPVEQR
jgi:hypothetical protein